jgi:hypothetical protein
LKYCTVTDTSVMSRRCSGVVVQSDSHNDILYITFRQVRHMQIYALPGEVTSDLINHRQKLVSSIQTDDTHEYITLLQLASP